MRMTIEDGDRRVTLESSDLVCVDVLRNFVGLLNAYGFMAGSVDGALVELAEEVTSEE